MSAETTDLEHLRESSESSAHLLPAVSKLAIGEQLDCMRRRSNKEKRVTPA